MFGLIFRSLDWPKNKVVSARIYRLETSDQGTFGRLSFNGLNLFTGELPWKDNASNLSCIPEGRYQAHMTFSPHFKRMTYQLFNVPGRNEIRIHAGNFMGEPSPPRLKQLNGCIALGEKAGVMEGQKAILVSAPAITKFESLLDRKPFILEIKNGYR